MNDELQNKIQTELEGYKLTQKKLQKAISNRQQLDGQLHENMLVKNELDVVPSDTTIYKSVGPVLIKTELIEAKQNVSKRMDYIGNEIKRIDEQIETLKKKQDVHQEALQVLQQQFQVAQMKTAKKS